MPAPTASAPLRMLPVGAGLVPLGALGALVVLAVLAGGCTSKVVEPPPAPQTPVDFAVPDSIQEVFTNHCAFSGCHAGAGAALGHDLSDARTSWLNVVGVASAEVPAYARIAPGDSANSYLVMKLKNDPRIIQQPMPRGGGFPLDPVLVRRVALWAEQGALGVPWQPVATALPRL